MTLKASLPLDLYKTIFDILPFPCALVKPDSPHFTIVEVNDKYLKATLSSRENVLGKGIVDVFKINADAKKDNGYNAVIGTLNKVLNTKKAEKQKAVRYDIRISGTDNYEQRHWIALNIPVVDDTGEIIYILNAPLDITEINNLEKREQQAKLGYKYQKEFLNSIFSQAPVGIGVWKGPAFITTKVNPALTDFYNKTEDQLMGKPIFEIFPEAKNMGWEKIMTRVMETGIPHAGIETAVDLLKGLKVKRHYVSFVIVPYHEPEGKISGVLGVSIDTTKEVKLRKELRENELKIKIAVESAKMGIWDLNLKTQEIFSSSHLLIPGFPVLGYHSSIEKFIAIVLPEDRDIVLKAIESVPEKSDFKVQIRVTWSDESIHWLQLTGRVLRDQENEPARIMGTTLDITEIKELELRKNELISTVSHELKTPVTSIKAMAQILERKFDGSEDNLTFVMLHKMGIQIKRLTSLIHDLLDASLIEGGKLQLKKSHFLFNELTEEAINEVQRITPTHEIILKNNNPIACFSDKERIRQVIINLLTNAVKYSPGKDKVIVTISSDGKDAFCSVEDYGVGISKEKKAHIFERFYRIADERHYGFQGIGLGLYIASEIIGRLNGKLWFDSIPNQGSTFSFSIPLS